MSRRIAVVGAGYFAQFHVQGWQAAGATVVALCDIDSTKAQAMATRFGVAEVFSDAATMIEALSPDVVDVVLPPAPKRRWCAPHWPRALPRFARSPSALTWPRQKP